MKVLCVKGATETRGVYHSVVDYVTCYARVRVQTNHFKLVLLENALVHHRVLLNDIFTTVDEETIRQEENWERALCQVI